MLACFCMFEREFVAGILACVADMHPSQVSFLFVTCTVYYVCLRQCCMPSETARSERETLCLFHSYFLEVMLACLRMFDRHFVAAISGSDVGTFVHV